SARAERWRLRRDRRAHYSPQQLAEQGVRNSVQQRKHTARAPRRMPQVPPAHASLREAPQLRRWLAARIDTHVGAQPDRQRPIGWRIVERDAYIQTLHHFYPITRGVLRRQHREAGAGARAQTRYVPAERRMRIGVDMDLHRLARAQLFQLIFFE